MRGGTQDVLDRDVRALTGQAFGFVEDLAWNHATIVDHDGKFRAAIVEHEAAGVQFVVDMQRRVVLHPPIDRYAERWRDVAGRRAGPELALLIRGEPTAGERERQDDARGDLQESPGGGGHGGKEEGNGMLGWGRASMQGRSPARGGRS